MCLCLTYFLVAGSFADTFKSGDAPLFPQLTKLVGALVCLPISNATVERLFSVMRIIKNKLRNSLAIPMVEAILTTRHGMKRQGQTCETFTPLPMMIDKFNCSMYDHHRRGAIVPPIPADAAVDDENDEIIQILDDVEEMFGDPIFLTN